MTGVQTCALPIFLLFCFAFVVLNGLFVAAEFALIGAPKTAIEHRAGTGDRLARRLLGVLESPQEQDRYIATSQLGITVASLALGMYGEPGVAALVRPWLGGFGAAAATVASIIALGLLTLAHIVFGEIAPKSLALQRADRIAQLAYWPMRITLLVFLPFVRALNGIANGSLRLIGIRRHEHAAEELYTPEELQLIVQESEQSGAIRAESGRLLRELFEFGDRTAAQAMQPRVRVRGVRAGAAPSDVRALVAKDRQTRYPLYEGDLDHIVGVVHARDLLRRLLANEPVTTADATPMPVVPESAALDDVLATMQRSGAHVAIVVDEHGGTAGLVSVEDLFEEVVGDIDEGTSEAPALAPLADGSVRAAGTLRLDEIGQHFDLTMEHEEVESISGLILAQLGRPPVVGDVVEYGRLHFEVTRVSGLGVGEVKVKLID